MKGILFALAMMGAFAASAVEESYLYWMIDTTDETLGQITYDTVQVRAYETTADGLAAEGTPLTLYYGNGNVAAGEPSSVSWTAATAGMALYASLASYSGGYSYVVELFNEGAKVGRSESLTFTQAVAENFIATVSAHGTIPAMAPWAAGGFTAVPEPNSALLLLLGCAALGLRRKKAKELK